MKRRAARADFFDASALVKIYSDEPCSTIVRDYFRNRPTRYTTPFCFYEALNILKGKWKHKGQLTLEQYLDAASHLTAWYGASSSEVKDLDFAEPTTFREAKEIAERNQLDLSDGFQILSLKKGYFSVLVNESSTILVTADRDLAVAARNEGLRAWNLTAEPPPE